MEMNDQLKNDRQKLMNYTHDLTLQNKDFLEQTLEEKDNFYQEKKNFMLVLLIIFVTIVFQFIFFF